MGIYKKVDILNIYFNFNVFYITTLFSISIVELLVLILARAPIGIVSLGEPCPAHRLYMQGF